MRSPQTLNPPVDWLWLIFYLSAVAARCPFIASSFAHELGLHAAIPRCHLAIYEEHRPFASLICAVPSCHDISPVKPPRSFSRTARNAAGLVTTYVNHDAPLSHSLTSAVTEQSGDVRPLKTSPQACPESALEKVRK